MTAPRRSPLSSMPLFPTTAQVRKRHARSASGSTSSICGGNLYSCTALPTEPFRSTVKTGESARRLPTSDNFSPGSRNSWMLSDRGTGASTLVSANSCAAAAIEFPVTPPISCWLSSPGCPSWRPCEGANVDARKCRRGSMESSAGQSFSSSSLSSREAPQLRSTARTRASILVACCTAYSASACSARRFFSALVRGLLGRSSALGFMGSPACQRSNPCMMISTLPCATCRSSCRSVAITASPMAMPINWPTSDRSVSSSKPRKWCLASTKRQQSRTARSTACLPAWSPSCQQRNHEPRQSLRYQVHAPRRNHRDL
mmetsp:Transcript_12471/g.31970  ORF Transcript_12471/g.31970 Transcript_12471/m.31970 type:complete len:316 (-) Transcript_12471:399-1346(-)